MIPRHLKAFAFVVVLTACAVPAKKKSSEAGVAVNHAASTLTSIATTADNRVLLNDPSASLNTPLCGSFARDTHQFEAAINPQIMASKSSCIRNACFSPLTGTYISATGARSVCR